MQTTELRPFLTAPRIALLVLAIYAGGALSGSLLFPWLLGRSLMMAALYALIIFVSGLFTGLFVSLFITTR
jgi:hypothetical protein